MDKIIGKANVVNSLQIAVMQTVSSVPYKTDEGFLIKNDSDEPVELEVNLLGMDEGVYITTSFSPGWNPEIVREIKSGTVTDIKVGY